jgi:hypothetical protein
MRQDIVLVMDWLVTRHGFFIQQSKSTTRGSQSKFVEKPCKVQTSSSSEKRLQRNPKARTTAWPAADRSNQSACLAHLMSPWASRPTIQSHLSLSYQSCY